MIDYPFTPCLNPRKIYNVYTSESLVVPCGHCKACLLRKSNRYTSMSRLEASVHSYTYFVTLTYSNDYLPKAHILRNENGRYDLVDLDSSEVLCSDISLSDDYIYRLQLKMQSDYIPYLNKYDLQLFIKRLRKHYGKLQIRYHAVGEYGPAHFRPHYHLLLWFETEEVVKNLSEIIREKWSFGRVDVQISNGDCARYVSGYANSFSFVPSVLKEASLAPFCVHSQRLGFKGLTSLLPKVYESTFDQFVTRSYPVDGSYKTVYPWRSYTAFFFPRCRGFADKTHFQRLHSYKLLQDCRRLWSKESLVDIADYIYRYIYKYQFETIGPEMQCIVDRFEDLFPSKWVSDNYDEKSDYIKGVIYRDLLVSSHFYYLLNEYSEWIETQVGIYVGKYLSCEEALCARIEQFWSDFDYHNLVGSLQAQERYFIDNPIDDLELFYSPEKQENEVARTLAYRRYASMIDSRFDDSIKHKKQNDINRLLY